MTTRIGQVNVAYRYWFTVRTGSGAPRTGLVIGDFDIDVRDPTNTNTESVAAVTEVGNGMYFFDISAGFTLANGAGTYGIVIELTSAPLDVGGGAVLFNNTTLDAVPGDVWEELRASHTTVNTFGEAVDQRLTVMEDNIRGVDNRDLTNIAGAGWVAADNLVQAHNKLDGIQADIDNFENITRFKVSIPPLERPEAGTTLHEIYFNLKDDQGLPVNADGGGGGTVTVEATSFGGISGDRDGRLGAVTMTNIATGRYVVTFSVASTDILEGIHFFFSWAEGGNANNVDKSSHVVDGNAVGYLASDRTRDDQIAVETASLDGTKITTARANNLDEITAARLVELDGGNMPSDIDDILADTAVGGPGPWTTGTGSTPQQVRDAMKLAPTAGAPAAGSIDDDLDIMKGAGFITGDDSLEAIRDRGDAAWTTFAGGGGLTAQQTRDSMKLTPTVGAPDAGSVDAHLDDILADTAAIQPTVAVNLDATVSSRSSHSAADVDALITASHGAGAYTTATGFAVPGDAMALTPAERTAVATAVRDIGLAASAVGGLGEGVLIARNGKVAYRIDNYVRNATTGFANTARLRIFPDQATAAASTSGGVGEGELVSVPIAGTPDGTFLVLPSDIVGG